MCLQSEHLGGRGKEDCHEFKARVTELQGLGSRVRLCLRQAGEKNNTL